MKASIDGLLAALAHSSAAAGVLVLLVLALQALFRPLLSPRWQCALWLIVIARLLPFSLSSDASLFNLLPRWQAFAYSEPPSAATPAKVPASSPLLQISAATSGPTASPTPAPTDAPALTAEHVPSVSRVFWTWSTVVFFCWFAGAAALGGYVVIASVSLARSLKRLPPLKDPEVLARLEDCCRQLGLRRAPGLIVSESVRTPALHGLLRPRVLLPLDFTTRYSAEEQRFVFLHELAHVQRRDLWLNWLVTALQVIHWFNPLVWFGFARWRADREIACDAAALEAAGGESRRAYGRTMLRVLQTSSIVPPHPGLVGIMADQRQLRRRLQMIATFTPAQRPIAATALFALLAVAGLTDAQVAPALAPSGANASDAVQAPPPPTSPPAGPYVLFLIDGSASLAEDVDAVAPSDGETPTDYRERGRTFPAPTDTGRPVGPKSKWHLAASLLEDQLGRLPVETDFHVAVFFDDQTAMVGGRSDPHDRSAIPDALARFRQVIPRGAANLETAFGYVADTLAASRPERIVLLTDGLPTKSLSSSDAGEVTEAQRVASFQAATKKLPPRIPVHIVLLPRPPGDPTAVGHFWMLAHATGGGLTAPANRARAPRTHLAFVIDTSGSMRSPNRGDLWPAAIRALEAALDLHPQLVGLQLLDGDGRFILGRRGMGASAWHAVTPELREQIRRVLATYNQDTVSSPAPGIYNAMRFLHDRDAPEVHMGIYVLGDEFNASDPAGVVLDRLDALNPRDVHGRRAVTINAIGFPTAIRYRFSMVNTGVRFANLMRLIAQAHDGEFTALADL